MTKKIELTKGQFAIVDDLDYEDFNRYSWQAQWNNSTKSYYAVRYSPRVFGKQKKLWMHREVNRTPDGMLCDHIDHNTLNNTRENLRSVTKSQNGMNRKGAQSNSSSGVRGVVFKKNIGKWEAKIRSGGKDIYLGVFETKESAIDKAKSAREKIFGEFNGN